MREKLFVVFVLRGIVWSFQLYEWGQRRAVRVYLWGQGRRLWR